MRIKRKHIALGTGSGILLIACSWSLGTGPKDGYGGVYYDCEVMIDESMDPSDSFSPQHNRCVDLSALVPNSTAPIDDGRGNTIDHASLVPGCSTYVVDACMPRMIQPFSASGNASKVNLEQYLTVKSPIDLVDNGDISAIPNAGVQVTLQEYCRFNAYMIRLGEQYSKTDPTDPNAIAFAADNAKNGRPYSWIVRRSDFVEYPSGKAFRPFFGTQPVHTAPAYCAMDKPDDSSFPLFGQAIILHHNARFPAGIAKVDSTQSSAIVTVQNGNDTHAAPTTFAGETAADLSNCVSSAGVDTCDFALRYLTLVMTDFTIGGKNVSNASLRGEGVAFGQAVGDQVSIDAGKMRLVGQLNVEGQGVSTQSFTNPAALTAQWDPVRNTFRMNLALSTATVDGQVITVNGTVTGTFLNRSPTPVPPKDQIVECSGPAGTTAQLDGSASYDLDGNMAGFEWRGPDTVFDVPPFGYEATVTTPPLSLGAHAFRMTVKDAWAWSDSEPTNVTVRDTLPPQLSISQSVNCLWPPNHDVVELDLGSQIVATAVDQCSGDVSASVKIIGVTSDEAVNAAGSGNTNPDIAFDDHHVCLREERNGDGSGRTYSITLQADDGHGNITTKTVDVVVPHDQSGQLSCASSSSLPPCSLIGATPSQAELPTTAPGNPAAPSPSAKQLGCSLAPNGAEPSHRGFFMMMMVVAVASATRRRLRLWSLALSMAACSSSSPRHGTASLVVQVDTRPPVSISADPIGFVQGNNVAIQIASNSGTVFVSGPASLFVPNAQIPVGSGVNDVVVWAKTSADPSPLTATAGNVLVNQFDSSPAGSFALSFQGIMKPMGPTGPAMTASGDVNAKWAQPN